MHMPNCKIYSVLLIMLIMIILIVNFMYKHNNYTAVAIVSFPFT